MRNSVLTIVLFVLTVNILLSQNTLFEASDFTAEGEFTSGIEGPATDKSGLLYAVNFGKQGTIGYVTSSGDSHLFVELPENSIGNGIRVNSKGNLFIADYTNHNVLEVDIKTKDISVHTHSDQMNQPNDLAITKSDILFLSDPNWKEATGNLWKVDKDGTLHRLESDMGTTNGIEVSPDETRLYVNESEQRRVWLYDLDPDGNVTNKRLFYQFEDHGLDGMRCDIMGNLYITRYGKGTVVILSPEATLIHEVELKGDRPTNITFGGSDGKTCYVTLMDRGCFEMFRTDQPGREWAWHHRP